MIDPKAVTTYAQYKEDIILAALLDDVKKGFYVDVGANYPLVDSVTQYFYQRGWHGINIEPLKSLYDQLVRDRPRDVNLNLGAGEKKGSLTFREFIDNPGHSTFDAAQMTQHGAGVPHSDYAVDVKTLKDIFSEYKPDHIHFIKIDVEGFEYQVVAGNDWRRYRPEVICIEANHVSDDWRPILTRHKYKLFIFDGLNEYYVAQESWSRTKNFAERVIALDYHALRQHQQESWAADSRELTRLHGMAQAQQELIQSLQKQATGLRAQARLSLHNRSWPARFKRAVYGLTIDWLRYKRPPK